MLHTIVKVTSLAIEWVVIYGSKSKTEGIMANYISPTPLFWSFSWYVIFTYKRVYRIRYTTIY